MTVLLIWILRVLVILMILRYISMMVRGRRAPAPRNPSRTRTPERTGGALARDPHCGTYVPQASALQLAKSGSTFYFCSPACRDAWLSGGK